MAFIVFTYRAKTGMYEKFEKFLMEVDQPKVRELPSVKAVWLFRVQPDEPFRYVELVEVTSRDAWNTDHAQPDVMEVVEAFAEYGDVESIRVYDGELIYQYADTLAT